MTWTTPIDPPAEGVLWCVFESPYSGQYEFMCHPRTADELVNGGMTHVNGQPVSVCVVGYWPGIHAVQVKACVLGEERQSAGYSWQEAEAA